MNRIPLAVACLSLAASLPCSAGGTLRTDALNPLLQQKPEVFAALHDAFELRDSAWAWIRIGDAYPALSGTRLGPYEIEATSRPSQQRVDVVLCTKATYYDSAGRVLSGVAVEQAVRVTEVLTAVMLRMWHSDQPPVCP
ncbi:hypothetical protein [Solimonas marina]|uniref:Uncharacterized protein n=1 Tax=Solimonas marina TaxID=2714601 RepID=A0A969WCY5_9GAMM|nr:hypothetical protein [Solimonas marina]NKF23116.1 hypothetical protein [Solimonas marina]